MDTSVEMIVIKGKPRTFDIKDYSFDSQSETRKIVFKDNYAYSYGKQNVKFLKDPQSLDPEDYQIWRNKKVFNNITGIFVFKDTTAEYWRICFRGGSSREYRYDELEVKRLVPENDQAKQVFEYLREAADYVSVRTEDNQAILTKQYEKMISFSHEKTAADLYLNPEEYSVCAEVESCAPIFPFGCNESQFKAVTNALVHRISVIEGPPGTGKTQTILNILANLVLQGKSAQVVSCNNSAIDNVVEKLASQKYRMDFMVARLGNTGRKNKFIETQSGTYPDLTDWESEICESAEFTHSVRERSLTLQEIFYNKNLLAELRQERNEVQLEFDHLQTLILENNPLVFPKEIPSSKLLELWCEYEQIKDGKKRAGFLYRLIRKFSIGIDIKVLLEEKSSTVLNQLRYAYYQTRLDELNDAISYITEKLNKVDADRLLSEFTDMSLQYFRAHLAKSVKGKKHRPLFSNKDLRDCPDSVIKEYPVVLSTTYTARSSLGADAHFDYVIMDEASQIDVPTGMLALSCASHAVVVGDTKQLPNVLPSEQRSKLEEIFNRYRISSGYDSARQSLLSSLCFVMGDKIPQVMLCEHYRCHPQIIGFCNQKFYNGKLIIMTEDNDDHALQLVTTVTGDHVRDRMNQRQIDVIRAEVLPRLHYSKKEIGIIAPYRNHINQIKNELTDSLIDAATVHKFQGREKDAIILSTVDDTVTKFSDDPNLINVAVSRAKKKLIVVAADQEQPAGSNIGDLIDYIHYNNCDVYHSKISSVFDYLYRQYTEKRLEYLKKYKRISEYESENLMYTLIRDELKRRDGAGLNVICHQSLQLLFRDQSKMTDEERRYVNTGLSHVDFLIYRRVSKKPLLGIEVDGYSYHKDHTKQAERDKLKDCIFEKYDLPLLRFKTNGSGEREIIASKLDGLCNLSTHEEVSRVND